MRSTRGSRHVETTGTPGDPTPWGGTNEGGEGGGDEGRGECGAARAHCRRRGPHRDRGARIEGKAPISRIAQGRSGLPAMPEQIVAGMPHLYMCGLALGRQNQASTCGTQAKSRERHVHCWRRGRQALAEPQLRLLTRPIGAPRHSIRRGALASCFVHDGMPARHHDAARLCWRSWSTGSS